METNATFDIHRARAETRACESIIHFNNAGASLMPAPVSDTLHEYLHMEEQRGGYETAALQASTLENFYTAAARLLNCQPDEIAFVENGTRALDLAFYAFTFTASDRILTTFAEYGSNVVAYTQQAQRYGVEVVFVPNDEHGQLDVKALAAMIDERVKLISIAHIPTCGGLVNPAAAVGQIAKAAGIPYILDSVQGVGQLPLNVNEIGCQVLCGTGRKYLRGPRGTGLLYVQRDLIEQLEPPLLDQHAAPLVTPTRYEIRPDARRFETWEQHFAGKAALGRAIDYALEWDIGITYKRIVGLAGLLRERLALIDGVSVIDEGLEQCGIVTFMAEWMHAADIKSALAAHRINVGVSSGSGSLVSFQQRGLQAIVRASLHYYNTPAEIDYFVDVLKKLL